MTARKTASMQRYGVDENGIWTRCEGEMARNCDHLRHTYTMYGDAHPWTGTEI